jgi:hypothetical protein
MVWLGPEEPASLIEQVVPSSGVVHLVPKKNTVCKKIPVITVQFIEKTDQ